MASQAHEGDGLDQAAQTRERDVLRELREQMGVLQGLPGIGPGAEELPKPANEPRAKGRERRVPRR